MYSRNITILKNLGLTSNEAKIILALSKKSTASAKQLSEESKIAREIIYQIMPKLEKKGIIEKIIDKPTYYKLIPIEQATSTLLERKILEQKELRNQIQELVLNLKKVQPKNKMNLDEQFLIIPGSNAIIKKLSSEIKKIQFSLDVITSSVRFNPAIIAFKEYHKEALQRGIIIRMATQKHPIENEANNVINELKKFKNFELRFFKDPPEAIVVLFDNKEAYVTLSSKAELQNTASLWSKNESFMALAKNYFECKWKRATA